MRATEPRPISSRPEDPGRTCTGSLLPMSWPVRRESRDTNERPEENLRGVRFMDDQRRYRLPKTGSHARHARYRMSQRSPSSWHVTAQ